MISSASKPEISQMQFSSHWPEKKTLQSTTNLTCYSWIIVNQKQSSVKRILFLLELCDYQFSITIAALKLWSRCDWTNGMILPDISMSEATCIWVFWLLVLSWLWQYSQSGVYMRSENPGQSFPCWHQRKYPVHLSSRTESYWQMWCGATHLSSVANTWYILCHFS